LQLGLLLEKQILADTHLAAAGLDDSSTHNEVGTLPMEKWAPLTLKMLESLSYKLTDSQLKSVSEIMWDLQRPVPMRRLLQVLA
jgi:RecG-like helicase